AQSAALDAFQDEAGVLGADESPGAFVDQPLDAAQDAELLAAERQLLNVEEQSAMAQLGIQRGEDLLAALHLYPVTDLQIRGLALRRLLARGAPNIGIGPEVIEDLQQSESHEVSRRDIARTQIAHVLPRLPPVAALGGESHVGGLAAMALGAVFRG